MEGDGIHVDAGQYVAIAKHLRAQGAGKGRDSLLGMMNAELRDIAKPIMAEMRAEAVKGEAGGTTSAAAHTKRVVHATKQKKAEGHDAYVSRLKKKVEGGKGHLRPAAARSLRIVTRDSGYAQQVGVRITADGSRMPSGQGKLPRKLDNPGWRHPVFGHKDRWATTKSPNPGWFLNTAGRHRELATKRVERVLEKYATHLAALLNRAA